MFYDSQYSYLHYPLVTHSILFQLMFIYLRKDFQVKYLPRPALYALTIILLLAYVVLMILQITDWLTSYDGNSSI